MGSKLGSSILDHPHEPHHLLEHVSKGSFINDVPQVWNFFDPTLPIPFITLLCLMHYVRQMLKAPLVNPRVYIYRYKIKTRQRAVNMFKICSKKF